MLKEVLFKEDFKQLFESFGIKKGNLVLLQANLSHFGNVIGDYQGMLEGLMDVVGEQGCIVIPTFTYSTLDPACTYPQKYMYENWQVVRENIYGYDSKSTISQIYPDCFNQFMTYSVKRSNHPVYSFAYWGAYPEEWLKQQMNYPISFSHALKGFTKKNSYNVIIGDDMNNSLLLPAIAKTMNMGITQVQRSYIHRGSRNVLKTYLITDVEKDKKQKLLDLCYIQKQKMNNQTIYCVSIDQN